MNVGKKQMRFALAVVTALTLTAATACGGTGQGNKSGESGGQNSGASAAPSAAANQGASPSGNADAGGNTASMMPSASPGGGTASAQGTDAESYTGAQQGEGTSGSSSAQGAQGETMMLAAGQDGSIPIRKVGGDEYVQATKLLEVVGYKSVWDKNQSVLKFGDNDAAYELKVNSTEARKDEDKLQLQKAPVLLDGGTLFLPVSIVSDLLSEDTVFSRRGDNLVFHTMAEPMNVQMDQDGPVPQGDLLNFGEDPTDPYKAAVVADQTGVSVADEDGAVAAAALTNINIPAMIKRARSYMGVPYLFGAAPYPQSGRFDCSSYVQYVFGKYGITLPRTSRAQAKLGNYVSRTNLRVGDLLYFYVPGRFQSNKTVGHVGIYVGNYYMINASPLPKDGVQLININKPYWKRTYLYSKRIVY